MSDTGPWTSWTPWNWLDPGVGAAWVTSRRLDDTVSDTGTWLDESSQFRPRLRRVELIEHRGAMAGRDVHHPYKH
jgi:hypothetical protein